MSIAKTMRLVLAIVLVAFGAAACGDDKPGAKTDAAGTQKVAASKQQAAKPQVVQSEVAKPDPGVPAATVPVGDQAGSLGKPGDTVIETPEDPRSFYNPIGKVDPFKPLVQEEQRAVAAPTTAEGKTERPKRAHLTPLEKVDLSQLKLDGVILASSGNRAMVSDSTGKGYVVTVGTYMGIYSGRVVDILADQIIVEEEVENIFGKISLRRREMNMQKPLGE